tara:strand:+ start:244 stop:426 length:183 start_codon:yes stop_codon:yes gene_type:complete
MKVATFPWKTLFDSNACLRQKRESSFEPEVPRSKRARKIIIWTKKHSFDPNGEKLGLGLS